MSTIQTQFWHLIHKDDPEPLANYIESGGDLSRLSDEQREILARLVRGKSPRKRGQKLINADTTERNRQICWDVVSLLAYGLPAYSDSDDGAEDACWVVANEMNLSEESVRKIWAKRDPLIRRFEELYKHQSYDGSVQEAINAWQEKRKLQERYREELHSS